MATVTLTEDEMALCPVVGTATLVRGRSLRSKAVVRQGSVEDGGAVHGVVRADGEHAPWVSLRRGADGAPAEVDAECNCAEPDPCRHAVALLLAALAAPRRPELRVLSGEVLEVSQNGGVAPERRRAAWERRLASILDGASTAATPAAAASSRRVGQPLALQFELTGDAPARIAVRPVTVGTSGSWVRSKITWDDLDYAAYYHRHLPGRHLALLQELRSLVDREKYRYGYEKVIYLDQISSRRVWDLLGEAQESGLPLVMAGRAALPVQVQPEPVQAQLNVVRVDGEVVVYPALQAGEEGLVEVHFIGEPVHGLAWTRQDGAGPALVLARIAQAPPPMFVSLLESGPLRIPEADEEHFLTRYYPQLRHELALVSPDGSVPLPELAPPLLELTVTGLGAHRVRLDWTWLHQAGAGEYRRPLTEAAQAGSDVDGVPRQAVAEAVRLLADLPGLVEHTSLGRRPVSGIEVDGMATARLVSSVVPLLEELPGLAVRRVADLPDYREVESAPVIEFQAGDEAGSDNDWFDLSVTVTVDGRTVPFQELFMALAREESHLVLDDGTWFSVDRPEFAQLAHLIAESRALLDAPPATVRLTRFHAGLWDDVEQIGVVLGQAKQWQEAVRSLRSLADAPPAVVPTGLVADLRPYQEQGFGWLATLFGHGLGGVLADDMGLGKTLQALAMIQHVREQGLSDQPFLVVAPTSVVANWAAEAARFAPGLLVTTITETAARRGHDLADAVAGADLVITSYTLFRLEFEEYRARQWAGLLLDEAQNVKNHRSAGYRCAKELPTPFKLAITGTPMENNLMELWSLLSITAPGLFARADRFTEYYRNPIERERDTDRLAQLRRRMRPLMLRRGKSQVAADLPDRQEQVMELELAPRHRTAYSRLLQRERQKVLGLLDDFQRNRFEILRSLTVLRQASLDVSLVGAGQAGVPSTKLDALTEQLEGIAAEGHRVLVFSQFTRFLGRARERLDAAGVEYCYLDGTTRNRPTVIKRFRQGTAPVFLISLKAGGAGLNLTEADYVILLDPWWNPATEAQAVDRAHRIGQTRKVMVYRLVAKDTIEEKVMALKARKAELAASVLDGEDFASAALTADDVRALLD